MPSDVMLDAKSLALSQLFGAKIDCSFMCENIAFWPNLYKMVHFTILFLRFIVNLGIVTFSCDVINSSIILHNGHLECYCSDSKMSSESEMSANGSASSSSIWNDDDSSLALNIPAATVPAVLSFVLRCTSPVCCLLESPFSDGCSLCKGKRERWSKIACNFVTHCLLLLSIERYS